MNHIKHQHIMYLEETPQVLIFFCFRWLNFVSQNSEYCFLAKAPSSKLDLSINLGSVTTWLSVTTLGVAAPRVLVKWTSLPPNYQRLTTKQLVHEYTVSLAYDKIHSTRSLSHFGEAFNAIVLVEVSEDYELIPENGLLGSTYADNVSTYVHTHTRCDNINSEVSSLYLYWLCLFFSPTSQ